MREKTAGDLWPKREAEGFLPRYSQPSKAVKCELTMRGRVDECQFVFMSLPVPNIVWESNDNLPATVAN
jgi:hypothetical protein